MSQILQICNEIPNVGDRLASFITEQLFDLKVVRVFGTLPEKHIGKPVLVGLGSCLGYYGDWLLHVWGTGYEPGYIDTAHRMNPGSRALWNVHAVRGHVTRTILKLPNETPIGDPGILLPRIYQPSAAPQAKVRYFQHCENPFQPDISGIDEFISTDVDPFKAIDLIVASDFVFTEAMHIAILAHAYGIPWAWSLNKHTRGIVKWYDWFSSIGVRGCCFKPSELTDACKWYSQVRKDFEPIKCDELISSFPSDIAF